jgi:GGDEF domain-containing protein
MAIPFIGMIARKWPQRMAYLGGKLRPVTMSIGVSQLIANEKADKFQLRADLAMYEAKNGGGNQVILASGHIGV